MAMSLCFLAGEIVLRSRAPGCKAVRGVHRYASRNRPESGRCFFRVRGNDRRTKHRNSPQPATRAGVASCPLGSGRVLESSSLKLKPQGSETTVVLDHTGCPEGAFDDLNPGWKMRYWEPLRKFLA